MTREFARLTRRFGGVVAVAAVVAFVGGTASIAASENGKDAKKEDNRKDNDKDGNHFNKKKVWRKFWMCHVEKDGKGKLIEISEEAVAAHRGHGDGEPGERVAKHKHYRWARDCRETPEPPAPPPPPSPPPPPTDTQLSCPCWNGMMRSALLAVLAPTSSPASPTCINNSSTVSLSQDGGVTQVFAASFGQCIHVEGGLDLGSNFSLSGPDAATCMAEAAGLVPSIQWCAQ